MSIPERTINECGAPKSAAPEAVWRVCEVINANVGPCKRCPAKYMHDGEAYFRGCYLHAEECINTVETGNPWRKTEGVRAPFIAVAPEEASLRQVMPPIREES